MATVDFVAFVEKLADVAADTILPFFRTALRAEDKNAGGMFDPVVDRVFTIEKGKGVTGSICATCDTKSSSNAPAAKP